MCRETPCVFDSYSVTLILEDEVTVYQECYHTCVLYLLSVYIGGLPLNIQVFAQKDIRNVITKLHIS